jgi:hypothetical protein
MYLSFINYNDMLGINYPDKVRSTFVVLRNKFDDKESVLRLKYYGVSADLDLNYFRYAVADGYTASNTKITNNENYNLITKFDRTEVVSDWMDITEFNNNSVLNPDDFKSIRSIESTSSPTREFSTINETTAKTVPNQFSNINEIKATPETISTLKIISQINNLDSTKNFNIINQSNYSTLPSDIKIINSINASSNNEFKILGEKAYVANPKTFNELGAKSLADDAKTFAEPRIKTTDDKKTFNELNPRTNTQTLGSFGELTKIDRSGNGTFNLLSNSARTETTGSFGNAITSIARSGDGTFSVISNNQRTGNGSFAEFTSVTNSGNGSFATIANNSRAESIGSFVKLNR